MHGWQEPYRFAAALVLHSLGVSQQDIPQDYPLTNPLYVPPVGVGEGAPPEVRAAIQRVQADYLQASWDAVEQQYGGMPQYLQKGLGAGNFEIKSSKIKYLSV